MGKKLRDEDLKLNIIVNGNSAKKELGDLEKANRKLTSSNKDLRAEKTKLEPRCHEICISWIVGNPIDAPAIRLNKKIFHQTKFLPNEIAPGPHLSKG